MKGKREVKERLGNVDNKYQENAREKDSPVDQAKHKPAQSRQAIAGEGERKKTRARYSREIKAMRNKLQEVTKVRNKMKKRWVREQAWNKKHKNHQEKKQSSCCGEANSKTAPSRKCCCSTTHSFIQTKQVCPQELDSVRQGSKKIFTQNAFCILQHFSLWKRDCKT